MTYVPHDATHQCPDSRCESTGGIQYYRLYPDGHWAYWAEIIGNGWREFHEPCRPVVPLQPPIGVEFEWRYGDHAWKTGEALYIGSVYAILKARDEEQHYYLREMEFRPLRTSEQIAEQERKADIAQLMQAGNLIYEQAAALYLAGCRVQVQP